MSRALIRVPAYEELAISLAANESRSFAKTFTGLNIIELSGDVTMSINDNTPTVIRAGIGFRMPRIVEEGGVIPVTAIRFSETGGAPANLIIAMTMGDIQDNRASFAGNQSVQNASAPNDELQVKTKAGTRLEVNLDAADPAIAALITALQASPDLRRRWNDFSGATLHSETASSADNVLVTAIANTNGILIHHLNSVCTNFNANCYAKFGSTIFYGKASGGSGSVLAALGIIENLFLPAGSLFSVRADTTSYLNVAYTVL